MKRSTTFLLTLLISYSSVLACGPYYPYGEDIRFSLLKPEQIGFHDYSIFYYSADLFDFDDYYSPDNTPYSQSDRNKNVEFWQKRTKNKFSYQEVYNGIYKYSGSEIYTPVNNKFLKYLKKNDTEAFEYLKFAKEASRYNSFYYNAWEKESGKEEKTIGQLNATADKKIASLKDKELVKRYAFIAIRINYYANDYHKLNKIYNKVFKNSKNNEIIDYWSLYFKVKTLGNTAECNYLASQVFAGAPSKRFMVHKAFDKSISTEKTLTFAQNDEEKANIWLLSGILKHGKALENIKEMHKLMPEAEGLSFLLLRELNKLEDWILTPYYYNFTPAVSTYADYEIYENDEKAKTKIDNYREYAHSLLQFVKSVKHSKTSNPELWKFAESYLYFLSGNNSSAVAEIKKLLNSKHLNEGLKNSLKEINALALTAKQLFGKAKLLPKVKQLLSREQHQSSKFIFALARELEFKDNTSDAAILLSQFNNRKKYSWSKRVFWRTKERNQTLMMDFYDEYFFYLDAQYKPEQVWSLISQIENRNEKTAFDQWFYSEIKTDIPRLYDLLGTKYFRVNDLQNALHAFENVNDSLWQKYPYADYLDANPFYTNLYNEHRKTYADTVKFTKPELIKSLIKFLAKAEKQNSAYYYFLAANCYLNTSHYGNSWLMRRYFWSTSMYISDLPDEKEFYNCKTAKEYYLKAHASAENEKFAALCLRMAGRCEEYNLNREYELKYYWDYSSDRATRAANSFYGQLNADYPDYYDELISNCTVFEDYFKAHH